MAKLPWNDARRWLEARWGAPVARVGVDAGLGCPHRTFEEPQGGCAFCSPAGNRPPYQLDSNSIEQQVQTGMAFARERYGATLFSLYFQASSSTYAPIETLRSVYGRGLNSGTFVDLTVGTRPDCLAAEVVQLLAGYHSQERDVWVEVGLQSSNDATLVKIGRGHTAEDFRQSTDRLRRAAIPVTAHVMYGLPGESTSDFLRTVEFALDCGVSGFKFHDLMLVPGTRLYRQWEAGEISPVDPERYLDAMVQVIKGLPPEIVVWRVCSDPENRKAPQAPGIKWPKNLFINRLAASLNDVQALPDA